MNGIFFFYFLIVNYGIFILFIVDDLLEKVDREEKEVYGYMY